MEGTSSTSELTLHFSEEESRRQSRTSSQTVSVSDLTESTQSIPTIDVTIDDGSSTSVSGCSDKEIVDWTKQFYNLVEEAPLLQAAIRPKSSDCKGNNNGHQAKDSSDGGKAKEQSPPSAQTVECNWIDLELLEEGRKFVRRNFFAVLLAHFIGVAFLLTVRPIQSLLLRTSALHRKENTLKRYVKMILYLKRFYESPQSIAQSANDNASNDDCQDAIACIHNLQRNAARNFKVYVPPPWEDLKLTVEEQEIYYAVQEDTKQLAGICTNTKNMPKVLFTVNPDVPLSQYDLVIIQHAFFGFIAQFPRLFGIYEKVDASGNSKGINGFIHLWAVLGHVFGIEERFNLCLAKNYDQDTNHLIFKQVFLFSYKTINESAMRLWRSMTAGSSRYFFFFRTKAMMLFMCRDVAQVENCKHLNSIMKPMEKFCYYFYKFLIDWLLWVPPCRVAMNCSLRLSVRICQYLMRRAKKCESKWDAPTVCVIDPIIREVNGSNGTKK